MKARKAYCSILNEPLGYKMDFLCQFDPTFTRTIEIFILNRIISISNKDAIIMPKTQMTNACIPSPYSVMPPFIQLGELKT